MPTHAQKRRVPYTPEQMFDLVADIERYPEFIPWVAGIRIRREREASPRQEVVADLIVAFSGFRGSFTSRVLFDRDARRIDVAYEKGPLKSLRNHWVFLEEPDGACLIDFFVDFEFRNRILQKLMDRVFNEGVVRIMRAFEERAAELYDPVCGRSGTGDR